MSTFSKQDELPHLIVPNLDDTLNRYLKSARALTNNDEYNRTVAQVEDFKKSKLASQLQEALVAKSRSSKNWLEDWWYDVYLTVREPLSPFMNIVAGNTYYTPAPGSQIGRASDVAYHWMAFWNKIRLETLPITRSRGVVWDMHQYSCLFNSVRVPELAKDKLVRYFKVHDAPSHIVVFCRGNAWKLEMLNSKKELISPDEIYGQMEWIYNNSKSLKHSVITLTTEHRDNWAKARSSLLKLGKANSISFQVIDSAAFCISLVENCPEDEEMLLEQGLMANSQYSWLDKSLNLIVFGDGQMVMQGDHSNVDAIVMLHCGDVAAPRVRKELWKPQIASSTKPELLEFVLSSEIERAIDEADAKFNNYKETYRCKYVRYTNYGNAFLKKNKLYTDTVVQLALQLAFLKTHGSFGPIYETASTRKFYHGRTETVRGCTIEMTEFGKAVLNKQDNNLLPKLFLNAYNAHNKLMEEATTGQGIDRHLLGLRYTLEQFNKGCSPKQSLPAFLTDSVWAKTGGDGNFLLSTSFCGYMTNEEDGGFGYVCAMRQDGYGIFYRIGNDRICMVTTDWKGTKSNLDAFSRNVSWAFDEIRCLLNDKASL